MTRIALRAALDTCRLRGWSSKCSPLPKYTPCPHHKPTSCSHSTLHSSQPMESNESSSSHTRGRARDRESERSRRTRSCSASAERGHGRATGASKRFKSAVARGKRRRLDEDLVQRDVDHSAGAVPRSVGRIAEEWARCVRRAAKEAIAVFPPLEGVSRAVSSFVDTFKVCFELLSLILVLVPDHIPSKLRNASRGTLPIARQWVH